MVLVFQVYQLIAVQISFAITWLRSVSIFHFNTHYIPLLHTCSLFTLYVLWYKFIIAGIHPFLLENIRVLVSGCFCHIEIHFDEMKCSPRYTHCAWICGNARASFDLKSKSLVNDAWDLFQIRCVAEAKHLLQNVRSSNTYNNSLLQILKNYGNRYFFSFYRHSGFKHIKFITQVESCNAWKRF